jgi:opacity protein-like surface antigen
MKNFLAAFLVVLASTSYAQAQDKDATLELVGRYWVPTLKASARVDPDTDVRGTDIDLKDDLGLGNKSFPSGRVIWHTGPGSNLFLDYVWSKDTSEKTLEKTITFRDTTFDIGARVSSELKFQIFNLGWIWQFIRTSGGGVRLGTLLNVRAARISLSLDGQLNDLSQSASRSYTAPLPSLGFALDMNPHKAVTLYLYSSGLPTTVYGYFLEGEAGLNIKPLKNFSISAGYRYEDFKAKNKDETAEARLRFIGPFAGAAIRF